MLHKNESFLALINVYLYCVNLQLPVSVIIKPVHKADLTLYNLDPMYLFSHVFKFAVSHVFKFADYN